MIDKMQLTQAFGTIIDLSIQAEKTQVSSGLKKALDLYQPDQLVNIVEGADIILGAITGRTTGRIVIAGGGSAGLGNDAPDPGYEIDKGGIKVCRTCHQKWPHE